MAGGPGPGGGGVTDSLTDAERTFLSFALDLAQDRMLSEDGFTDEDEAALIRLRKLTVLDPAGVHDA